MDKAIRNMDWIFFGGLVGLATVGLFALHMSAEQAHPEIWTGQMSFVIAGLLGFILLCFVPLNYIRRASWSLYVVTLLLMIVIWRIWWKVDLGVFHLQYAGIMQWTLLLVLAHYLSARKNSSWQEIAFAMLLVAVPALVTYLQFDAVTVVALMLVTIIVTIAASQWRLLAVEIASLILFLPLFWFVLHDYAKKRILHWLFDPSSTVQYGYDFLKFTDDYRVMLIGLTIVIAALLILRMVMITCRAHSRFAFTLCVGITSLALLFLMQEIALVSGVSFVVDKLALFVVSYDGLAWVGLMAAMGIVMRVAIESKESSEKDDSGRVTG